MFGFFRRPVVAVSDQQWIFDTWVWLLHHFGGEDFFRHTRLVTPTVECFPDQLQHNEQAVEKVFERIKYYANMEDWQCTLEAQDPDVETRVGDTLMVQGVEQSPAGTFRLDNTCRQVVISFNPALLHEPQSLVATLAHELAHYLTATATEPPPGGWENWEPVTDVAAIFMGFGLFQANTAFSFNQYTDSQSVGWRAKSTGYLSESQILYALALFVRSLQIEQPEVLQHLKPALKRPFKRTLKLLDKSDALARLQQLSPKERS